jgi:hypothetical protein
LAAAAAVAGGWVWDSRAGHFVPRGDLVSLRESLVERISWVDVVGSMGWERGSSSKVKSEPLGKGKETESYKFLLGWLGGSGRRDTD